MIEKAFPPVLIKQNGQSHHLKRLARTHNEFDERFLQELLVDHPELLPVGRIRDDVGQLLCVGREVVVGGGGAIDNLYLSTGGYPVIVETKLWRNPQARREVLSQVLDYTKELVGKDFDWFESIWNDFTFSKHRNQQKLLASLDEIAEEEIDEATYVDRLNAAIRRGDILAMIVGDGIESRLQELVAHLCEDSSHLRYSLALVELTCYHIKDDGGQGSDILVVPRIIQNVEPVQRAYVRIEVAPELQSKVQVRSEVPPLEERRTGYVRINLSEDEFVKSLDAALGVSNGKAVERFYRGLSEGLGIETEIKAATVMLKVPDPNGDKPSVSVLAIERHGGFYNTTHIKGQLRRIGLPEEEITAITSDYWAALNRIDSRFSVNGISHMASRQFVPAEDLLPKLPDIESEVTKVVSRIREVLQQ